MFAEALLLASSLQIGPFYEQDAGARAVRPFFSRDEKTDATDVVWPLFASRRDWWRFCWLAYGQDYPEGGGQFAILPFWWNGRETADSEPYWGLFPLWGTHPHALAMHDVRFCLWPLWMRYRTPRKSADGGWMTTDSVLFPLFHRRDDGSWGAWPLCGLSHNRADDHRYLLWPILNWKTCREDRDTAGAGTAWMLWPLAARVAREREDQWMLLPPLFSYAETPDGWRGRFPFPLVEIERTRRRDRTSVFPFWEKTVNYSYLDRSEQSRLTRFGWRLVELLPDETRVFPFWTDRKDGSYFRLWPFWESSRRKDGSSHGRFLSLFPVRWAEAVDRNWAKFWTFYERDANPVCTEHSLFWGLAKWRTFDD